MTHRVYFTFLLSYSNQQTWRMDLTCFRRQLRIIYFICRCIQNITSEGMKNCTPLSNQWRRAACGFSDCYNHAGNALALSHITKKSLQRKFRDHTTMTPLHTVYFTARLLNSTLRALRESVHIFHRKNRSGLVFLKKDTELKDKNDVFVASVMAILMSQFSIDTRPLIARDWRPTPPLMNPSNTVVEENWLLNRLSRIIRLAICI